MFDQENDNYIYQWVWYCDGWNEYKLEVFTILGVPKTFNLN